MASLDDTLHKRLWIQVIRDAELLRNRDGQICVVGIDVYLNEYPDSLGASWK